MKTEKNDKLVAVRIPIRLYKAMKATGKPITYFLKKAIELMVKEGT